MLTYNDDISQRGEVETRDYDIYCPVMDFYGDKYQRHNYLSMSCKMRQRRGGCPECYRNITPAPVAVKIEIKTIEPVTIDCQCKAVENGERCLKKRYSTDFCTNHYRWIVLGKPRKTVKACEICGGRAIAQGMCRRCYDKQRKGTSHAGTS